MKKQQNSFQFKKFFYFKIQLIQISLLLVSIIIAINCFPLANIDLQFAKSIPTTTTNSIWNYQYSIINNSLFYIDGNYVYKKNMDTNIIQAVYQHPTGTILKTLTILKDLNILITGFQNLIAIWDFTNLTVLRQVDTVSNQYIQDLQYSAKFNEIFYVSHKNNIFIYDFQTLNFKVSFPITNINLTGVIIVNLFTLYEKNNKTLLLHQFRGYPAYSAILDYSKRPFQVLSITTQSVDFNYYYRIAQFSEYDNHLQQIVKDAIGTRFLKHFYSQTNYTTQKISIIQNPVNSLKTFSQQQNIIFLCQPTSKIYVYNEKSSQISEFISVNQFSALTQFSFIKFMIISSDNKYLYLMRAKGIVTYKILCKNHKYYDSINKNCIQCDVNCKVCQGEFGECLQCNQLFYLKSGKCFPCEINCLNCTQNYCFSCNEGFLPWKKSCLSCSPQCQACQISRNNCTKCSKYYAFNEDLSECVLDTQGENSYASFAAYAMSSSSLAFNINFLQIGISMINEFWPYYYHNRTYGNNTQNFLQFIHTVSNSKWLVGNLDKKIDFWYDSLGFSNYNSYSYYTFLMRQGKSSIFFDSIFEIIVYSTPLSIVFFFILYFTFRLLSEYRISLYFRRYFFNISLLFMLIEGNWIYLVYCSFNQSKILFFFSFSDKMVHSLWSLLNYILVFYSISIFFLIKFYYKKLSKYFVDQCFNNFNSIILYTILTFRGFLIGAVHAMLNSIYYTQISLLIAISLLTIIILLYFEIKFKTFKQITFLWTIIIIETLTIINQLFLITNRYSNQTYGFQSNQAIFTDQLIVLTFYIIMFATLGQIISTFIPQRKINIKNKNMLNKRNNIFLKQHSINQNINYQSHFNNLFNPFVTDKENIKSSNQSQDRTKQPFIKSINAGKKQQFNDNQKLTSQRQKQKTNFIDNLNFNFTEREKQFILILRQKMKQNKEIKQLSFKGINNDIQFTFYDKQTDASKNKKQPFKQNQEFSKELNHNQIIKSKSLNCSSYMKHNIKKQKSYLSTNQPLFVTLIGQNKTIKEQQVQCDQIQIETQAFQKLKAETIKKQINK